MKVCEQQFKVGRVRKCCIGMAPPSLVGSCHVCQVRVVVGFFVFFSLCHFRYAIPDMIRERNGMIRASITVTQQVKAMLVSNNVCSVAGGSKWFVAKFASIEAV